VCTINHVLHEEDDDNNNMTVIAHGQGQSKTAQETSAYRRSPYLQNMPGLVHPTVQKGMVTISLKNAGS
jgi:hypothetical protein